MRKQRGKYFLWSAEMLESKWHQLSSKRERLVNTISKYDAQMKEVKGALKKVKTELKKFSLYKDHPTTASDSVAAPKEDTIKDYHAYLNYEDVQKENEALKESIKELLPYAEYHLHEEEHHFGSDAITTKLTGAKISRAKAFLDKQ